MTLPSTYVLGCIRNYPGTHAVHKPKVECTWLKLSMVCWKPLWLVYRKIWEIKRKNGDSVGILIPWLYFLCLWKDGLIGVPYRQGSSDPLVHSEPYTHFPMSRNTFEYNSHGHECMVNLQTMGDVMINLVNFIKIRIVVEMLSLREY